MADRIAAYALAKKFKEATPEEAQILYLTNFRKGNHITMDFNIAEMCITDYLRGIGLKRYKNDTFLENRGGFEVYDDSVEREAFRKKYNVITAKDLGIPDDAKPLPDVLLWF